MVLSWVVQFGPRGGVWLVSMTEYIDRGSIVEERRKASFAIDALSFGENALCEIILDAIIAARYLLAVLAAQRK